MKSRKKVFTGMMAFLLLAMLVGIMPNEVKAASTTKIYFQNTGGWTDVYCYIWKGTGPVEGTQAWPGEQMTKIGGTDDWFELDYSSDSDFQVIFTDNAGKQTGNLPIDQKADKAPYWFVLAGGSTDKGTSDGLTPEGLSLEILREAPASFPVVETEEVEKVDKTEKTQEVVEETNQKVVEEITKVKDEIGDVAKTGDKTNIAIPLIIAIAALCVGAWGQVYCSTKKN